jgi:hypothetical protein
MTVTRVDTEVVEPGVSEYTDLVVMLNFSTTLVQPSVLVRVSASSKKTSDQEPQN